MKFSREQNDGDNSSETENLSESVRESEVNENPVDDEKDSEKEGEKTPVSKNSSIKVETFQTEQQLVTKIVKLISQASQSDE